MSKKLDEHNLRLLLDACLNGEMTNRMEPCHKCGVELEECWNLAPIGASADNEHRIYADGVYLCDECHDVWATSYGIQPLDGE